MKLNSIIAEHYLSDDLHELGTDKGTTHAYIKNVYHPIFDNSETEISTILEIGISHGASLALWKYASPSSQVIGFDIQKKKLHPEAEKMALSNQIQLYFQDAYSSEAIEMISNSIDLIIDDGPHSIESQIDVLDWLRVLSSQGTLVIEDIEGGINSIKKILRHVPIKYRKHCLYFTMSHQSGRFDDTVLVITQSDAIFAELQKIAKQFSFWGMKSRSSWYLFRILNRILVFLNLRFDK